MRELQGLLPAVRQHLPRLYAPGKDYPVDRLRRGRYHRNRNVYRAMIKIKRAPKDYAAYGIKWFVVGRYSIVACLSFSDALRYFLWRLGVPARIAFRKYKKK